MRRWLVIASAIVALGALSGAAAYQHAGLHQEEAWQEIAWPFPARWLAGGQGVSLRRVRMRR